MVTESVTNERSSLRIVNGEDANDVSLDAGYVALWEVKKKTLVREPAAFQKRDLRIQRV